MSSVFYKKTSRLLVKSLLILRKLSTFHSLRMPEGPELNLSAKYVNTVCRNKIFSGSVVKSVENAKNPEINWNESQYSIYAESRGKELKLTLSSMDSCNFQNKKSSKRKTKTEKPIKELKIVFNFGMSGRFNFCEESEMVKHSHLTFFTSDSPPMILSFVDVRRFGRWRLDDNWAPDRGPCVMLEYPQFRENVLENLDKTAFNKAICEVLLNQSYFNGIGNYLRAEILYRADIRPFDKARDVLQKLVDDHDVKEKNPKQSKPDILKLCNQLCHEVINLGATIYNPVPDADYSKFTQWLQCFYKDGMLNMVDHNKRTIWYSGDPGPMVPKEIKRKGLNMHYKKHQKDNESTEEESPTKKPKIAMKKLVKPKEERDVQIKKQKIKRVTRTTLKAEIVEEPDVKQKIKEELIIESEPVTSEIEQKTSVNKSFDSSTSQSDASEILANNLVEKLSRVKAKLEDEKMKRTQPVIVKRKKSSISKLMRKRY